MRIVFMGTGEIAIPTLQWLIGHCSSGADSPELVAVYTQPDKPIGRRQVLTAPEVKRLAEAVGIPVRQPEILRGNEAALAEFAAFRPDLVVVMAYDHPDAYRPETRRRGNDPERVDSDFP